MRLNAAELILARSQEPAIRVRPAIHHAGGVVTYAELGALVNRAANAFLGLGVAVGDRVPLLLADGPLYAGALLGLMKIGAVPIPLNSKLKAEDYAYIAADCGAKLLVHEAMHAQAVGDIPGLRLLPAREGGGSLMRRMNAAASQAAYAALDAEDPCFWLYSSGTTGRPKGVVHAQRGAAESSKILREVLGLDETAIIYCTSKLFFAFALDNALFGVLRIGAATVLCADWAEPEAVAAMAARIGPDAFFTVPTFFRRLLQLGEDKLAPFRDVPFAITGGERLPDGVALKWREATGRQILGCHGMSETFCNNFCNFPDDWRLGACGRALEAVEPMLLPRGVRPGERQALGAGEPGVLWVRHPALALRYNDPQKTADCFFEGWFCTNDQFHFDADGFWFHEGRADELFKVAGQWVKPQEVEDAVLGDDVREAACVVVADGDGFERLALYVVPGDGDGVAAAQARAHASLPAHSWPKWVRSIAELPRTPTGKVQKFRLKEMLLAELAPQPAQPDEPALPAAGPDELAPPPAEPAEGV
jgi:benzoate-CoA ligase